MLTHGNGLVHAKIYHEYFPEDSYESSGNKTNIETGISHEVLF